MTSRTHTPEDVQKIIEPWSPVSIGVDVTEEGAHVIGIYAMSENYSRIFYSKYYPSPQRTWVGLLLNDMPDKWRGNRQFIAGAKWAAKYLKEKNT
jgi:hypothetical protein